MRYYFRVDHRLDSYVGVLTMIVLSATIFDMLGPLAAQQSPSAVAPPLAFREVTVIDVSDGHRLPNQTVVVVGNHIQAVGPTKKVSVPAGTRVVEAQGKYLVPGFWDMHAHPEFNNVGATAAEQDSAYRVSYSHYIANGITGIREMGQRWASWSGDLDSRAAQDSFVAWQRQILAGTKVGPRAVGPSTDLAGAISDPDGARRMIDEKKAAGDAFFKLHGYFSGDTSGEREIFFALMRESRRVGLPVVGHVPQSVTNVEAADSGIRSLEHVSEHQQCWKLPQPLLDSAALEAVCRPVVQAYLRNQVWLTPTMATWWTFDTTHVPLREGNSVEANMGSWADVLRFCRTMHRLGIKNFLAGTDWGSGMSSRLETDELFMQGLSTREEIVFLADAGLSPLEALQAGTLNPARFFQMTDSLGTVAPGKLADMVLLDGDPLADITNVLRLQGVVANGRYFDRAALVQMDSLAFKPGVGLVAADRRR